MQKIIAFCSLLITLVIGFEVNVIEEFLLKFNALSWTVVYFIPKILLLVFIINTMVLMIKLFGKRNGLIISSLFSLSSTTAFFINAPIYQSDLSKYGSENVFVPDSNSVISALLKDKHDFNGVFCIVSPTCDYCFVAGQLLKKISNRHPNLDLAIFVLSSESSEVQYYINKANTKGLNHYQIDNYDDAIQLNQGGFPCYFYFKEGKIKQRWHAEELGYRALDLIENWQD